MKRSLCLALFFLLSACSATHTPIPPGVIPEARTPTVEEEQYGHEVLNQLTEKFQLDYNNPELPRITDIVDRLTAAANANADPWHVYLFKDDSFMNSAATRGNHVFVWTGMLNAVKNDEELAGILAHEIGHVLAHHTDPDPNEEVQRILINVGAMAAGIAVAAATRDPNLGQTLGDLTSQIASSIGEGILVNPFSQDLELEADRIGLMIVAEARYNPESVLEFWRRAENDPKFSSPISLLSTHPPAEERLKQLQEILPLAMERYRKAGSAPTKKAQPKASLSPEKDPSAYPPLPPLNEKSGPELRSQLPDPEKKSDSIQSIWRTTAESTTLYSKPSRDGERVGSFNRGTLIRAVSWRRGWLEIETPDHGYVDVNDVEPKE